MTRPGNTRHGTTWLPRRYGRHGRQSWVPSATDRTTHVNGRRSAPGPVNQQVFRRSGVARRRAWLGAVRCGAAVSVFYCLDSCARGSDRLGSVLRRLAAVHHRAPPPPLLRCAPCNAHMCSVEAPERLCRETVSRAAPRRTAGRAPGERAASGRAGQRGAQSVRPPDGGLMRPFKCIMARRSDTDRRRRIPFESCLLPASAAARIPNGVRLVCSARASAAQRGGGALTARETPGAPSDPAGPRWSPTEPRAAVAHALAAPHAVRQALIR